MKHLMVGGTSGVLLGAVVCLLLILAAVNIGSLMPNRETRLQVAVGLLVSVFGLIGVGAVRHYGIHKDLLLAIDAMVALNLCFVGSRRYLRESARIQAEEGRRLDPPTRVVWRIATILIVVGGGLLAAEAIYVPGF